MEIGKIKSIIESIMFVYSEPISKYKLAKAIDVKRSEIYQAIQELDEEYIKDNRGFRIIEVNNKYQITSNKDNHKYIEKFCKKDKNKGLSNAALEVLSIIAYKQPVTRMDIESIRGVRSGNVINNLIDRELVKKAGVLKKIGNPIVYKTTEIFLKSFGLESIEDLPEIDDYHNFEFLSDFKLESEDNEDDRNAEN
ncbi:MAG: SMC-Scp complex subunit ScpB [Bacillota bacterium]